MDEFKIAQSSHCQHLLFFILLGSSALVLVVTAELGVCPSVDSNSAGSCVNECTDDSNCTNQLCCSNGCGNVCMDPVNCSLADCPIVDCREQMIASIPEGECCPMCILPNGCIAQNGSVISFGTAYGDCNGWCICESDRSMTCTSLSCDGCIVNDGIGYVIDFGETYDDDCNTCTCNNDRSISCTEMDCNMNITNTLPNGCIAQNGSVISFGTAYGDCNGWCICESDRSMSCTSLSCDGCIVNDGIGYVIDFGETYDDDCNTCTCNNDRSISCTEMDCNMNITNTDNNGGSRKTTVAHMMIIFIFGILSGFSQ